MSKRRKHYGNNLRWAKRRLISQHGSFCMIGNHPIATMHEITLDHLMPRSKGGNDEITNLQLACSPHNTEKRDMTPEEWAEFQAEAA